MRKNLFVAAALAAFALSSQAATVTVLDDTFSDTPGNNVRDDSGGGPTTVLFNGRTLVLDQISPVGATSFSRLGIGFAPNLPAGELTVSNDVGVNSIASITWTLGSLAAYTLGNFSIFVTASDPGTGGATMLSFTDATNTALSFSNQVANTVGQLNFGLTAADLAALSGGTLTMRVTGGVGYDIAFDNVRLTASTNSVPEPGSLALLGLAALGMAVAKRRKA